MEQSKTIFSVSFRAYDATIGQALPVVHAIQCVGSKDKYMMCILLNLTSWHNVCDEMNTHAFRPLR